MSKTLGKLLDRVRIERQIALANTRTEILERNALKEEDIDGIRWRLDEEVDTTRESNDMIQFRLYQLVDASTTLIKSSVKSFTENGIENMPQIKNKRK